MEALLVIDPQKVYTSPDSELYCRDHQQTISKINQLIESFRGRRLPIVYVRHQHKADGSDLGRMFDFAGEADEFNFKEGTEEVEWDDDLLKPHGESQVVKQRYSAFEGTNLDDLLKRSKVSRLVICGFMTNFCCESTARQAHDKDYFVNFLPDATGAPDLESLDQAELRRVVAEKLEAGYAVVQSTDEYLSSV